MNFIGASLMHGIVLGITCWMPLELSKHQACRHEVTEQDWNEFLFRACHRQPYALDSGWDVNTVVSIRSPKVSCIILKKYIHVFREHESFSSISAISLPRRSP